MKKKSKLRKRLQAILIALIISVVFSIPVFAATSTAKLSVGASHVHTSKISSSNGNVCLTGQVYTDCSIGARFGVIMYETQTYYYGVGETYYVYPGGSVNTGYVSFGGTTYAGTAYPMSGNHGTHASVTVTTP